MSIELKQAMGWAVLAARCAGEPHVTRSRVVTSLLRTSAVADLCARVQVAPAHIIQTIEDPHALSFEECARQIHGDLAERGLQLGSREHLASVQPVPMEPALESVFRAVFQYPAANRSTATSLEFLLELMRADSALADRFADHGLTEGVIRAEVERGEA